MVLVRLGGYAVGVFSGRRLVASKVGTRNVQGRTSAGGQSQKRYERRREGQARVSNDAAAEVAVAVLRAHADDIEAVVLGGDKFALAAVLEDPRLRRFARLTGERVLDVPDPRLAVLRATPDRFRATRPAHPGPSASSAGVRATVGSRRCIFFAMTSWVWVGLIFALVLLLVAAIARRA